MCRWVSLTDDAIRQLTTLASNCKAGVWLDVLIKPNQDAIGNELGAFLSTVYDKTGGVRSSKTAHLGKVATNKTSPRQRACPRVVQ